MPRTYSKETEDKLNKSLDDVAREERKNRRAQRQETKRNSTRNQTTKPKQEKRTTKNDSTEKPPSIKFEVEGDTKRDIFNAAGIGKQNAGFPAINIKIAVNKK